MTAFVTGAAQGLGRAICKALAEDGHDIVAGDLASEDLSGTIADVEGAGRKIVTGPADVRDQAALDALVTEGIAALGHLDAVVANAGISNWNRFWEMPEDQWQRMIDVNLTGVWHTFKACVPSMIERGAGGSIVAISSVAGLKSLPGQAHYSAAKHGVVGLVKSAAIELGPYGIRVNSVHPWGIATRLASEEEGPWNLMEANPTYAASFGAILDPPMSQPEDIAEAVVWLASDRSRSVTGAQLPVDKGATKV